MLRRAFRVDSLTGPTEPVELVGVREELVAVSLDDFLLERFDARLLKLDDLPALDAHQVIVMGFGKCDFVVRRSISKIVLFDHAGLMEEGEGSVDGPSRDRAVDASHIFDELLGCKVEVGDCATDDQLTLGGQTDPFRAEELFDFHKAFH